MSKYFKDVDYSWVDILPFCTAQLSASENYKINHNFETGAVKVKKI